MGNNLVFAFSVHKTMTSLILEVLISRYFVLHINLEIVQNMKSVEFRFLVSNCSEYRPNNSTNIKRYCRVIGIVENLLAVQVGTRTQKVSHSLSALINLWTTAIG